MNIQNLETNKQVKDALNKNFEILQAAENDENFQKYLRLITSDLAKNLTVNLELFEKDITDPVISKTKDFGAIESLKRVLLPLAEGANYKATNHPDWSLLAGRLESLRLKLLVPETFKETLETSQNVWLNETPFNYYDFCVQNAEKLEALIVPERDFSFYFFGIRTLEKSYLMKYIEENDDDNETEKLLETPQMMYLRIATFLWMPNIEKIKEYYDLMSLGYFTHASPTMFNCGIKKGSLASCYLLSVQDDAKKIYKCLSQCAMISKSSGGIGLDISNIRHSKIGFSGHSSGIVPMLKVYDATMKYINQEGRRKGSATIFLQPWHLDFPDFLLLRRQEGAEEFRARDLFYAMWSCDLFMKRVENDEMWTLFCPKYAPMLKDTIGDEFDKWYLHYENTIKSSRKMKQVRARELWNELLTTQIETGMPFIAHRDTANRTSNQQNLGVIRSSNLCMEITEVTDETTISSCNLASICLDEYVNPETRQFDFVKLGEITRKIVQSLNHVIDRTIYPLRKQKGDGPIAETNKKYRPLGIGVQALADTFLKMDLAWTDAEAKQLNKDIFATIYYNALLESCELTSVYGKYTGFEGSPASKGLLKPHLIALERARKQGAENIETKAAEILDAELSKMYDWNKLAEKIQNNGLANSLLVALMPTASTAQIRYKNESFEPFTTNMYVRSVLSGNHLIVNRYMVNDLKELKLWNKSVIDFIIKHEGSISELPLEIVDENKRPELLRLKEKYKTAFELSQKLIVDMAVDRSLYICQSQSLNIHIKNPTFKQLTSLHFYAWKNCLTTGMYYLRTAPSTEAVKFTVEGELDIKKSATICTEDVCISCSS